MTLAVAILTFLSLLPPSWRDRHEPGLYARRLEDVARVIADVATETRCAGGVARCACGLAVQGYHESLFSPRIRHPWQVEWMPPGTASASTLDGQAREAAWHLAHSARCGLSLEARSLASMGALCDAAGVVRQRARRRAATWRLCEFRLSRWPLSKDP